MEDISVENPAITLPQHEAHSEQRAAHIEHSINKLKETNMATENVFHHGLNQGPDIAPMAVLAASAMNQHRGIGDGFGMGGGLGAGLLGGILGGALLGNNGGLFGNRGVGPAGDTGLTNAMQLNSIQTGVADVKAAVPLAAAQTQNAVMQQSGLLLAGQTALGVAVSAEIANLKDTANAIGLQNLLATNNVNQNVLISQLQTQAAVAADGDRTRALISSINDATLNRIITTQANEITELKGDRGLAATGLNINQTVTQVQAQAQAQQQQQQQLVLLAQIAAGFSSLQNAVATNSNLIVGNTGATTTGAQTANPVNVRA